MIVFVVWLLVAAEPVTVTATSVPVQRPIPGFTFDAHNVLDRDPTTSWQPKPFDAAVPPWLELRWSKPRPIIAIDVWNGFQDERVLDGREVDLFRANARATKVRVTAGAITTELTLDPSRRGPQRLDVTDVTTDSLRIVIVAIADGARWKKDVALSDVALVFADDVTAPVAAAPVVAAPVTTAPRAAAPKPFGQAQTSPRPAGLELVYCLVGDSEVRKLGCDEVDDTEPRPPRTWVPMDCVYAPAYRRVGWHEPVGPLVRTTQYTVVVDDSDVVALGACGLGITPRAAASRFVPLPGADTPPPNASVFSEVASRVLSGDANLEVATDKDHYLDLNGDGVVDWLAAYSGRGDGDEHTAHYVMTEGLAWADGRKPRRTFAYEVGSGIDWEDGMDLCGLIDGNDDGLLEALVVDYTAHAECWQDDVLLPLALDPTRPPVVVAKDYTPLDPRPVARVRKGPGSVYTDGLATLGEVFGLSLGMSQSEVAAVLGAKAPLDVTRVSGDDWALASGPTLHFSDDRLAWIKLTGPDVARAIAGRGLDDPLLDLLGQSLAAAARGIRGRVTPAVPGVETFVAKGLKLVLMADTSGAIATLVIARE